MSLFQATFHSWKDDADMIELVMEDRCVRCDLCVGACPNDVFEAVADRPPVIARKADCHICYLCEAYCPVDALYVAPINHSEPLDIDRLAAGGLLGSYARDIGWEKGRPAKS